MDTCSAGMTPSYRHFGKLKMCIYLNKECKQKTVSHPDENNLLTILKGSVHDQPKYISDCILLI